MIIRIILFAFLMAISSFACAFEKQSELKEFASNTKLQFAIASNFGADRKFTAYLIVSNHSKFTLPAGAGSWKIYLHSIRKLEEQEVAGLKISHVQGDLHSISATDQFAGLASGQELKIQFTGANWMVSYSDFMPRAFIVVEGLQPVIFTNTNTENLTDFVSPFVKREQQLRQPDDQYAITTAQSRFNENLAVNTISISAESIAKRIFPTPKSVEYLTGTVSVDKNWQINHEAITRNEANYLQHALREQAGLDLTTAIKPADKPAKLIILRLDSTLSSAESYRLDISADNILITGSDLAGLFYGIQSMLSLIPANQSGSTLNLPQLRAIDAPRFAWRGMHYDMARNFHSKEVTLRLIEQMARFKLNKLHLHLSDDEGWRLQIPGLPELTDIGATRCFDLQEQTCLLTQLGTGPHRNGTGNGYYTRQDFIEILKFATDRHIEVIPEIDMPGHSRAAIKSMQARYHSLLKAGELNLAEQYLLSDPLDTSKYSSVQNYNDNSLNVCRKSSYQFISKVIDEVQSMYESAGIRLKTWHMGGDEVAKGSWQHSPDCQVLLKDPTSDVKSVADLKLYFVKQLSAMLQVHDIALVGWEDGLMVDATTPLVRSQLPNQRIIADVWDNIWEWGVADRAYRLANANYQVVLAHATHLYFDHPQEVSSEQRGYYWATRYSDAKKVFGYMPDDIYANADKTRMGNPIVDLQALVGRPLPKLEKPANIIGMQGNVWSETIRTDQQLEQMVYPRILMMAERAWHKAEWEGVAVNRPLRDVQWSEMAHLLALREIPKLQKQGVSVYLPPPGVQIVEGKAHANTAMPGLNIEYSLNQGNTWQVYTRPVLVQGTSICFRSYATSGTYSKDQCVTETK